MAQEETFDFSDPEQFRMYESESCEFLSTIIAAFCPDCIVLVHRKGERIFRDLFHHNRIIDSNVPTITDDEIRTSGLCDGKVLVFDDSMRTGNSVGLTVDKIRSISPDAVVEVATLVSNVQAVSELSSSRSVTVHVLYEYPNPDEQVKKDRSVFYLTYGAGIRFGTGYPSVEMETNCFDHSVVSGIVDILLSGLFGEYEVDTETSLCRDAEKHVYRFESMRDDLLCTSDQKVFLYVDNGICSQMIRVEVLINPSSESLEGMSEKNLVAEYVYGLQKDNLDCLSDGLSRGLSDRGFDVFRIRQRIPSECEHR